MSHPKPVKVLRTYTDGKLEFYSEQLRSVLCRADVAAKKVPIEPTSLLNSDIFQKIVTRQEPTILSSI